MKMIRKVVDIWRLSNYYRGKVHGGLLVRIIVGLWTLKTQAIRVSNYHIERRKLEYYH